MRAGFETCRTGFVPHESIQMIKISQLLGDHCLPCSYFYQPVTLVCAIAAQRRRAHIRYISGPAAAAPAIAKEKGFYVGKLHFALPVQLELNKKLAGAYCQRQLIIDQYGVEMYIIVQLFVKSAGEMQGVFHPLDAGCSGRHQLFCQLHGLKGQYLSRPVHGGIIRLKGVIGSLPARADLQALDIPTGALDKKTIDLIAERLFHFSAGHSGIVGGDGIVETNDVRMTGIVHDDGLWRTLCIVDADDAHLGVYGTEGYPLRILTGVLRVGEPGLTGMPILPGDQAVEPQLREAAVSSCNAGLKKMLTGLADCRYYPVFVIGRVRIALLKASLASGLWFRMIVRRAKHQLGDAITFLTGHYHSCACKDGQVHGDESQLYPAGRQHQGAGVYGVMNGFVGVWGDINL